MPRRGRDRHDARQVDGGASTTARRTVRVRPATLGSDGDRPMLIRAVVHARLLGLRLLTLDARVVVADLDSAAIDVVERVDVDPALTSLRPPEASRRAVAADGTSDHAASRPGRPGLEGGVTRARELLAQGADTLARTRR